MVPGRLAISLRPAVRQAAVKLAIPGPATKRVFEPGIIGCDDAGFEPAIRRGQSVAAGTTPTLAASPFSRSGNRRTEVMSHACQNVARLFHPHRAA